MTQREDRRAETAALLANLAAGRGFKPEPYNAEERPRLSAPMLAGIEGDVFGVKLSAVDYRAALHEEGLCLVPHLIQEAAIEQWLPTELVEAVKAWVANRQGKRKQ